ncbi:hypothetical protein [Nonomuraea sp. NPDC048916]|uniref:hypothetical protein n=1 Tax=Nonomuraea sp. NPDC048916 TaxID=3154232 RepID=UPI0033D05FE7
MNTAGQHGTQARLCPTCQATGPMTDDHVATRWTEDGMLVQQIHAAGRFHGHGGFVVLPEWADILDRYFPAADR